MNFTLTMSPGALGHLTALADDHAATMAEELRAATPEKRAEAKKFFARACEIVAACAAAEPVAPATVVWPKLPHTRAELKGAEDAGLDPDKELGPHDPRARDPSCVHGRKFTEECKYCAGEIDPIG
jgi:hypothetical protein